MARFIKLHQKNGFGITLNAEYILSIKDMRNDPACKALREWHFSVIGMAEQSRYQVEETEEQILAAINS